MPYHNFQNLGQVQDAIFLDGILTAVYSEDDTCDVNVTFPSIYGGGERTFTRVPIFYHCKSDSEPRDNGALINAASAFCPEDDVVVMMKANLEAHKVIAFKEGKRGCIILAMETEDGVISVDKHTLEPIEYLEWKSSFRNIITIADKNNITVGTIDHTIVNNCIAKSANCREWPDLGVNWTQGEFTVTDTKAILYKGDIYKDYTGSEITSSFSPLYHVCFDWCPDAPYGVPDFYHNLSGLLGYVTRTFTTDSKAIRASPYDTDVFVFFLGAHLTISEEETAERTIVLQPEPCALNPLLGPEYKDEWSSASSSYTVKYNYFFHVNGIEIPVNLEPYNFGKSLPASAYFGGWYGYSNAVCYGILNLDFGGTTEAFSNGYYIFNPWSIVQWPYCQEVLLFGTKMKSAETNEITHLIMGVAWDASDYATKIFEKGATIFGHELTGNMYFLRI